MGRHKIVRPERAPACWNCGGNALARRLMKITEVAAFCRVSHSAVYQWMAKGLVEWVYTAGGKRRIFKDSLFRGPEQV
jgi:helix-turn-helix protein